MQSTSDIPRLAPLCSTTGPLPRQTHTQSALYQSASCNLRHHTRTHTRAPAPTTTASASAVSVKHRPAVCSRLTPSPISSIPLMLRERPFRSHRPSYYTAYAARPLTSAASLWDLNSACRPVCLLTGADRPSPKRRTLLTSSWHNLRPRL